MMAMTFAVHPYRSDAATPPPASAPTVVVYRTFMPEAGPSSFAVGLGANLGFCYDPGRGGISYIWRGDFVDLGPTWKAKINNPADLRGEIVHRELVRWPLRLNRPEREPTYEFKGYALLPDAVEFHYLLDGILVREEIRAAPDGSSLIRRFRLGEPCENWWLLADAAAASALSSDSGSWDQNQGALAGRGGREFSIRVNLKGAQP